MRDPVPSEILLDLTKLLVHFDSGGVHIGDEVAERGEEEAEDDGADEQAHEGVEPLHVVDGCDVAVTDLREGGSVYVCVCVCVCMRVCVCVCVREREREQCEVASSKVKGVEN